MRLHVSNDPFMFKEYLMDDEHQWAETYYEIWTSLWSDETNYQKGRWADSYQMDIGVVTKNQSVHTWRALPQKRHEAERKDMGTG